MSAGEKWKNYYKSNNLVWFNAQYQRDESYYRNMYINSEIITELVGYIGNNRITNILEAGCGTGELSICLSSKYNNISAFDYNIEAISIVNKLMIDVRGKINTYVDDLLNIKYKDKKYDYIFNQAVFEYFTPDERVRALNQLKGLLNPNGQISIIAQNTIHPFNRYFGQQPRVYKLSPEKLLNEFSNAGFSDITCKGLFSSKVITNLILPKESEQKTRYFLYKIFKKIPSIKYLTKKVGSQFIITGKV